MNKLTRKWRKSHDDDDFSLPTLDDSRPMDTQGLSLSLSALVAEKLRVEKGNSIFECGGFQLLEDFNFLVYNFAEQEELIRSLEKTQAQQSRLWRVFYMIFVSQKKQKMGLHLMFNVLFFA